VGQDDPAAAQDLVGYGEEELREGLGLDAEVGEGGEDEGELIALPGGLADGVAVVEEMEGALGVPEELEPGGPVGEGEAGGGEVSEVGLPEAESTREGRRLAGGDAGPAGVAGAVEPGHPPGAGIVGLGGGRRGVAPGEGVEEVPIEGVRGMMDRIVATVTHWSSPLRGRGRGSGG